MSRSYHKFTEKEDKVILSNVKLYHYNLSESFRKSSDELGLPIYKIKYRYYEHLTKNNHCFLSISQDEAFVNKKIITKDLQKHKVIIKKNILKKWYLDFVELFKKF